MVPLLDVRQKLKERLEELRDHDAAWSAVLEIGFCPTALWRQFDVTQRTFQRIFKATTGQTASDWILEVRINEAKKLLREDWSVEDVAEAVGYATPSGLCRVFKEKTGMTAGEWQELEARH